MVVAVLDAFHFDLRESEQMEESSLRVKIPGQ